VGNDVLAAVEPVVDVLEALGVRYRIGGSVASSVLGVPRSTLDVDVACELRLVHAAAFAARLIDAYYVDEDMIRDAIQRQSCFNVIHLETMLKVDLFVRRDRPFEDVAFERVVRRSLDPAPSAREFDVTTPEDIVIHKLEWFRAGGEVSERQWRDAVGVLAIQRDVIDRSYLQHWAGELGLQELLARALAEAGRFAGGRGDRD
jgi:hypothetical protein